MKSAPFDVDTGITVSNGGLNAPIADFAKYLDFLTGNPGKQKDYDGVLKRSSLEEMFRPVLRIGPDTPAAPGRGVVEESQGLIFFIEKQFGTAYIAHSGSQNAFETHFYFRPESRTSYAVAFNTLAVPKDEKAADPKGGTGDAGPGDPDLFVQKYLFLCWSRINSLTRGREP